MLIAATLVGTLLLGLMAVAVLGPRAKRVPTCPSCDAAYQALSHGPTSLPPRSYDVLFCPHCSNTATSVHGQPSSWAYCPSCRQRALQTPSIRVSAAEEPVAIDVAESCHLCGYRNQRQVRAQADSPQRGLVITFPGAPARSTAPDRRAEDDG